MSMASTRLLSNLDPNLPPLQSHSTYDSAGSGSDDGSGPATPSKDKMREWTFPRPSSALPSSSSLSRDPLTSSSSNANNNGVHGRSSSIAPSPSKSSASPTSARSPRDEAHRPLLSRNGSSSRDFRHRTNASLAFVGSVTPEVGSSSRGGFSTLPPSSSSPSTSSSSQAVLGQAYPITPPPLPDLPSPPGMARMVYSNIRRKGLNDILYLVVFGGTIFLFFSALLGVGYSGASPSSLAVSPRVAMPADATGVVEVEIPKTFLRPGEEDEVPADVHQPYGEVPSHDEAEDHFRETPGEWEEVVGDEAVHEHPHPALRPESDPALFPHADEESSSSDPLDDAQLLEEHEEALQRGPARLVAQAALAEAEAAGEQEVEEVEEEEQEDEVLDDVPEVGDEDPEPDLEDDSISIDNPPLHSDGSLHLVDDDFSPSVDENERSALEELLDASLEEEEEEGGAGLGGGREGREELDRLARAREARRGGSGGPGEGGRMKKVRRVR
ncbi:hypothetical protein JCM8547_003027 [Rhodosporidiobolus lusitaniae]